MQKWSPKGLIGVVHLPAFPGDPLYDGRSIQDIISHALADATALIQGGVDALIIENFGSTPFPKGNASQPMPPHHVAIMSLVAHEIRKFFPEAVIGINCLRNDALASLGIAIATNAQFIRVNILCGAFATDQGIIEGCAYDLLRYRQLLGANHIAILADVLVKHASPIAPISATDSTKDNLKRGGADAVIVTGSDSGAPVDRRVLEEVFKAADGAPVLLGSGTKAEMLPNYCTFIKGAIVGTSLKTDGIITNPVDVERVKKMSDAIHNYIKN